MPANYAKEYLIFLHFLARVSNGRQYSNFENKCPKLGTGTPEDMVLSNLGDSLDSDPSGFVLLSTLCSVVYLIASSLTSSTLEFLIITGFRIKV